MKIPSHKHFASSFLVRFMLHTHHRSKYGLCEQSQAYKLTKSIVEINWNFTIQTIKVEVLEHYLKKSKCILYFLPWWICALLFIEQCIDKFKNLLKLYKIARCTLEAVKLIVFVKEVARPWLRASKQSLQKNRGHYHLPVAILIAR